MPRVLNVRFAKIELDYSQHQYRVTCTAAGLNRLPLGTNDLTEAEQAAVKTVQRQLNGLLIELTNLNEAYQWTNQ